jgi:hypothetical protein
MGRQSKAKRKPAKRRLSGPLQGWGATDGRRPDIETAGSLHEFLDFEGRKPEAALPDLLEALRASRLESLDMIADMLDPTKPGRWKLELKRHIKGKALSRSASFYEEVHARYTVLQFALEKLGARSPRKATERILEEECGWSAADIRNAIRQHSPEMQRDLLQKMIDERKKRYGESPAQRRMSAKERDELVKRIRIGTKHLIENESPRRIAGAAEKFWNAAEKKVQDTDPGPPAMRGWKR